MASKYSSHSGERNEKSRGLLPCIGENEVLNQSTSYGRGLIPKSPSKRRIRVNSEPYIIDNSEEKDSVAAVRSGEDAADDVTKSGKLSNNQKKLTRRVSVPLGTSTHKDSSLSNAKTTRSKTEKVRVKPKAPSPDVIDLSNEDVVHELMKRLYESLGVPDKTHFQQLTIDQNDSEVEGSCKQTRNTNECTKTDESTTRLPHVSKITSNLEVFYSKPASWKTLMNSRHLCLKTRTKRYLASKPTANKPVKEKLMLKTNEHHLTWPWKRSFDLSGQSTSVMRERGLSEPFVAFTPHSNSRDLFRRPYDSRKSVTFAE